MFPKRFKISYKLFNIQKWLLGVLDRHFEGKDALVLARSFIGKFENHKQSVTGSRGKYF